MGSVISYLCHPTPAGESVSLVESESYNEVVSPAKPTVPKINLNIMLGPVNSEHIDKNYNEMMKAKYYSRKRKSPSKNLLK